MSQEEIVNIFIQTMQAHADARPYDWAMYYVGLGGIIASLLVAYFAYQLNQKQITIAERQSKISEEQTEIAKKQAEIMEKQNNIALLEYRLKVFATINKVLVYLTDDKFQENFILCALDNNAFFKKMDTYTCLRDSFTEQAYNSKIVFDEEISKKLITASEKFNLLIKKSLELVFNMQVDFKIQNEENQTEMIIKREEFIKSKKIEMDSLPPELKKLFNTKEIQELGKEVYNILFDKKLQMKMNSYLTTL